MTDDKLDFLEKDAEESETENAQPVEAEPEAEPVEAEAEKGEEPAEPPAATEEPPESEDVRSVPVVALLDEREKRQLAQQEAKEARQKYEQLQRQLEESKREPQKAPDFYEDPDKAIQYHNAQLQEQHTKDKLRMSRFLAEREYGQELVGEAFEYFNQHPQESQSLMNEPSPFHAAVEHYKWQKKRAEIGNDPDAYDKMIEERVREKLLAEMAEQQPSKPKAPPQSLAKATAEGKDAIPQGGAFETLFPE